MRKKLLKLTNSVLFPSAETLQMCTVQHDGFELLEILLQVKKNGNNVKCNMFSAHSKKYWVVLTQFWVKYGQTQPLGYIFK